MGAQRHFPAALPPGKTRYPLYKRVFGPQGRFGRVRKTSPPPGFDPQTVQPVASRYTDCAIAVHQYFLVASQNSRCLNAILSIAVRLPTDATVYFVYLFPLFLPYMFRALISPSSGVSQAVFLYTTIWFMWCLCCSSACACGLVCRDGFTVLSLTYFIFQFS